MRKIFFWLHLTTGVCAGLLILTMCVTGTLLTYERQINAWADHRNAPFAAPPAGTARLNPEALIAKVQATKGIDPAQLTMYAAANDPAEIALGREGTLLVNPYTGDALGQSATGTRHFFQVMKDWHRWFGMGGQNRNTGKAIMDAGNLAFFFIVLSGIYMWFPRRMTWQHFRPVVLFRGGLSGKARDFNWHNVIGIWAWVPLFFIVGSGVVMSYQWANNLVYTATNSPLPAGRGGPQGGRGGPEGRGGPAGRGGAEGRGPGGEASRAQNRNASPDYTGLNQAWATAEAYQAGWTSIHVQVPANAHAPLAFTLDTGNGGQPQSRGNLTVDRTGAVVSWAPFSAGSPGQRVRAFLRFTHTGESLGIVGQTIAGIATAGGGLMVYTGIALSLRRLLVWRRRRRTVRETSMEEALIGA